MVKVGRQNVVFFLSKYVSCLSKLCGHLPPINRLLNARSIYVPYLLNSCILHRVDVAIGKLLFVYCNNNIRRSRHCNCTN